MSKTTFIVVLLRTVSTTLCTASPNFQKFTVVQSSFLRSTCPIIHKTPLVQPLQATLNHLRGTCLLALGCLCLSIQATSWSYPGSIHERVAPVGLHWTLQAKEPPIQWKSEPAVSSERKERQNYFSNGRISWRQGKSYAQHLTEKIMLCLISL